jgi:hypothetical protein
MLRTLIVAHVIAVPLVMMTAGDADAQQRGARAKAKDTVRQAPTRRAGVSARTQVRARPASVGSNGLCQRDTGTPTSQLNFRNRCDTEEFWARILERPGAGEN